MWLKYQRYKINLIAKELRSFVTEFSDSFNLSHVRDFFFFMPSNDIVGNLLLSLISLLSLIPV